MEPRIQQINAELDALRAERTSADAERIKAAWKKDTERAQSESERAEAFASLRRSLAQDLGVGVEPAFEAIRQMQATATGETRRLYTPLIRLWYSPRPVRNPDGPKVDAARESRHALAAMSRLPAVRAGDAAFGTDAEVRALPRWELETNRTEDGRSVVRHAVICQLESEWQMSWCRALVECFGIPYVREQAPAVESPEAAKRRLGPRPLTLGDMAGMGFFRGQGSSREQIDRDDVRQRELSLVTERWEIAKQARRKEYLEAMISTRIGMVAAIDRALAATPMGEGFWWTRQLRRIAATESPLKLTDDSEIFDLPVSVIFNLACANGARFDLNTK